MNARSRATGHVVSVIPGVGNPSFSSFESSSRIELNYTDRFNLKELSVFSAEFHYPNPWLNGALYVSRYGFDAYNETRVSVSFSRLLTEKWGLGIRINYDRLHYSETYSDKNILTADVGILIEPLEKTMKIGFVVCNPLQTTLKLGEGKEEETIPVLFLLGASYYFQESRFLIAAEVGKEENTPFHYKLGLEYQPFTLLYLRGGIRSSPFLPGFGIGLHLGSFDVNAGFSHRSGLGLESSCGICFSF